VNVASARALWKTPQPAGTSAVAPVTALQAEGPVPVGSKRTWLPAARCAAPSQRTRSGTYRVTVSPGRASTWAWYGRPPPTTC
jgi:hypothetical protein